MTTKIAVSLPDEQVAAARQAVAEGRAMSVSAYITTSLPQRHDDEDLAALLADTTAEAGSPTAEDQAWAQAALGLN